MLRPVYETIVSWTMHGQTADAPDAARGPSQAYGVQLSCALRNLAVQASTSGNNANVQKRSL